MKTDTIAALAEVTKSVRRAWVIQTDPVPF
jgi:hypothetical protein